MDIKDFWCIKSFYNSRLLQWKEEEGRGRERGGEGIERKRERRRRDRKKERGDKY